MKKQINNKKIATASMAVLGIGLIVGGAFAALSDTLAHNETVTIEWVDIVDGSAANLALEDVSDVTNTPVEELTPGITYELTGTLENDSTVITDWNATNLTTTPGMTVTIADANGNDAHNKVGEDVDVSQFGITVQVDQTVTPSTGLNFVIEFSSVDARTITPILEQPTAISAIFPDPALAACVANDSESGANGDVNYLISQAELDGIDDLLCANAGITSLEGMEYLKNLTILDLKKNQISDITPITNLNNLTKLVLNVNNINDITAITGLTNLEYLDLGQNPITNFTPIAGLINLETLSLYGTGISDISVVSELTNLTYLNLNYNYVNDISALSSLTNLEYLDLGQNPITNFTPIAGLINLETLSLYGTGISDISVISELTNLTYLNLGDNNITNIDVLANLTNLTYLRLDGNQITDISPLSNMQNLIYLDLENNEITDFSALSYKPTSFYASGQTITLSDTTLGTPTDIIIEGVNGEDLIITWTTPGTYENGQLTWTNPGVNSLTYASADGSITGTITQQVN